MPQGKQAVTGKLAELRQTLQSMKPGESFIYPDNFLVFRAAQSIHKQITTRKIGVEGYRVWLVK